MKEQEQAKGGFRVRAKQISPKIQMLLHTYLKKQVNSKLYFQQAQYSLYLQNNSHLTIDFFAPLFNNLEYTMQFKGVQSLNHVNVVVNQNFRKILLYRNKNFEYYSTRDIYSEKNNIQNCIHKVQTSLEPNQKIVHISKGCLDRQAIGIHLFITNFGKLYNLKISKEKAEILCLSVTNQISKYVNKIFNFLGQAPRIQATHYDSHLIKIDERSFQTFNAAILKDWMLQIHFISIPLDPIIPKINEIKWQLNLLNLIKNQIISFEQQNLKILKSKMTTLVNNNLILILLTESPQGSQIMFSFTINIQQKNVEDTKWQQFNAISQLDFHIFEKDDKNSDLILLVKFDYMKQKQAYIMVQSYSLRSFQLQYQKQIKQKLSEQSVLVLSENEIILASSLRILGYQFQNQIQGMQEEQGNNNATGHLNNFLKNIVNEKQNFIMRCVHDQNLSSLNDMLSEKKRKINEKLMSIQKYVEAQKRQKNDEQFKQTQNNLKQSIKTYTLICLLQEQIQYFQIKYNEGSQNQKNKYSDFFSVNQEQLKQLFLSLDMNQYLDHLKSIKKNKKVYNLVLWRLIKMLQDNQSQQSHLIQDKQVYKDMIFRVIVQEFQEQFYCCIDKMLDKPSKHRQNQSIRNQGQREALQYNSLNYPELQQMIDQNQNQQGFFTYEDNFQDPAKNQLSANYKLQNQKQEELKTFIQKCIEVLPFPKDIYRKYLTKFHHSNDFKFLYKIALKQLNSKLFSVLFFQTNFLKIKNLAKYYQVYNDKQNSDCNDFVQEFLNEYLNEYENKKQKKQLIPIGQIIETFRHHHELIYMYLKQRSPKIAVLVGLMLGKRSQLQKQSFQTSLTLKNPKYVKILLKACDTNHQVVRQELTAEICKKLIKPEFFQTETFLSRVGQNKYQKEIISKRSWDALKNYLLQEGNNTDIAKLQKKVKLSAD